MLFVFMGAIIPFARVKNIHKQANSHHHQANNFTAPFTGIDGTQICGEQH
jgi:hypothetical protein